MDDLISRQAAIDALEEKYMSFGIFREQRAASQCIDVIKNLPSAQIELIRCKDCIYGYLYMDVQNGVTDGWIECRNPEGLNRDVSVYGYCYASIRREERA